LGRLRRFMADVKQDFDRELNSAELAELRQLKQELHDTRRQIEESSNQLYNTIAKESAPDSVAPVAPPPEAPANRDAPVRPPAARRKRTRRTPTSDGGTGKA